VATKLALIGDAFGRVAASTKKILHARFDDGEGLPPASRHATFAARVVTLVATLWIVAISFWEIAAPFGAGHYAAATAVTTSGENMLRHGIIGAVPRYLSEPPAPHDYYCHHPWGTFWTAAPFTSASVRPAVTAVSQPAVDLPGQQGPTVAQ